MTLGLGGGLTDWGDDSQIRGMTHRLWGGLTDQGDVEGQSPPQEDDGGLGVPVVVDVGHGEGHEFGGDAVDNRAYPEVLPATTHNKRCKH